MIVFEVREYFPPHVREKSTSFIPRVTHLGRSEILQTVAIIKILCLQLIFIDTKLRIAQSSLQLRTYDTQ